MALDRIALQNGILALIAELKSQTTDPVASGEQFAEEMARLIDEFVGSDEGGGYVTPGDIPEYNIRKNAGGSITLTKDTADITTLELSYTHYQGVPSAVWIIPHNLGKQPSITTTDSTGEEIEGHIEHNINDMESTVTFNYPISGKGTAN